LPPEGIVIDISASEVDLEAVGAWEYALHAIGGSAS